MIRAEYAGEDGARRIIEDLTAAGHRLYAIGNTFSVAPEPTPELAEAVRMRARDLYRIVSEWPGGSSFGAGAVQ